MMRLAICLLLLTALPMGPALSQATGGGGLIDFSDSSFTGDNGGPPPIKTDRPDPASLPQAVWVAIGGQQAGPFDGAGLIDLLEKGQITPDTKVWMAGMGGWLAAGEVAALSPLFADPTVGPPDLDEPALAVYVAVAGQAQGPFDAAALAGLVSNGSLTADTQVWMEGMPGWTAASQVAELSGILGASPPGPDLNRVGLLVGTWRTSGDLDLGEMGMGNGTITVMFGEDRSYRMDGDVQIKYVDDNQQQRTTRVLMRGEGRWVAEPEEEGVLQVNVKGTFTFSAPELGVPEESSEVDEGMELRLVDENTLQDVDDDITYQRIRG